MSVSKLVQPNPLLYDPIHYPGVAEEEEWPPPRFDFQASWLRDKNLAFERGVDGQIIFVRRFESMRLVLDVETAHTALDLVPGSHDFLLLRLIPSALRLVDVIVPGDPMPPALRGQPHVTPPEHMLYAATTAIVNSLTRWAGDAGAAYLDALGRTPRGLDMFENAAARCVTHGAFDLDGIARLARALRRLARAHAEVLSAHAAQPDYLGMERSVRATSKVMLREAHWSGNLIAQALRRIIPLVSVPRETADALRAAAVSNLDRQASLNALPAMIERQHQLRDRLVDLGLFWRPTSAAWASVHPEATDRREIDMLCRHLLRRLRLKELYERP